MHSYPERYVELESLGDDLPSYEPTYPFGGRYLTPGHRYYAECAVNGPLIDVGIDGWLRREDALKIYELSFLAEGDILELGSYCGLSTSIIAKAVKESGRLRKIDSVDIKKKFVGRARNNLKHVGLQSLVSVHQADATAFCKHALKNGRQYAFVFIDHSHEYQLVREVCETFGGLVAEGGFCLFHDYNDNRNRDPADPNYGVYQGVHDGLDMAAFEFHGIFGCTGLFRRRSVKAGAIC